MIQYDLFAQQDRTALAWAFVPLSDGGADASLSSFSDTQVLTALRSASLQRQLAAIVLLAERQIAEAVPDLLAFCRRYIGYDRVAANTEHLAAIEALGRIGGREAANGLLALFRQGAFGLHSVLAALIAAHRMRLTLPGEIVAPFLRADDPDIREAACKVAGVGKSTQAVLCELLSDLHRRVALAAAAALGRERRPDGAMLLRRAVEDDTVDTDVVDAIAALAEDNCDFTVLLRRLSCRGNDVICVAARQALEDIGGT